MRQLAVPVHHLLVLLGLLLHQRAQANHQVHQVGVDRAGLLRALAAGVGAGGALAASEIDDAAGRDHFLVEGTITHDVECAHRVRSRRVVVHLGLGHVLLVRSQGDQVHSLLQRGDLLLLHITPENRRHREVGHVENALCIATGDQTGLRLADARRGRQQIVDVVLVVLEEAHFQGDLV